MNELTKFRLSKNIVPLVLSFILGGLLTYFGQDYYKLKTGNSVVMKKTDKRDQNNEEDFEDALGQMDQIGRQMSNFLKNNFFAHAPIRATVGSNIHIVEREDHEYKYLEIDGRDLDQEGLQVNVANGVVSLKGEIKKINKTESGSFISSSSFRQSFSVPYGVDETGVQIESHEHKIVIKFPKVNS